ncbi:MAG: hypothetical protein ACKOQ4_05735, partial [Mycobacterium sp.]
GPSMGPTTVLALFGGDTPRLGGTGPTSIAGINGSITAATLNTALDVFRRGGSYLTVALADSADSTLVNGSWQRGTLGRKFATFYGTAPAQPPVSIPMVYSVSSVETANGQVTAVILRNPTGSDAGGADGVPVSYRDANPNDGLVRITVAELLSSSRGFRLTSLPTGV